MSVPAKSTMEFEEPKCQNLAATIGSGRERYGGLKNTNLVLRRIASNIPRKLFLYLIVFLCLSVHLIVIVVCNCLSFQRDERGS